MIINRNLPKSNQPIPENKLNQIIDRTISELTEDDLKNATSIGNYVFYSCSNLSTVGLPSTVTTIGNYAFYGCTSLTSITITDSITDVKNYAFAYSGLKNIHIGNNNITFGQGCFNNCALLEELVFSDNVTAIGNSMCTGCTALTKLVIGNGVTEIPASAFGNCPALSDIILGDNITIIGNSAFSNCNAITNLTLGSNIANIDGYAFSSTGLVEVTIKAIIPPTIQPSIFNNVTTLQKIYIPTGTLSAYQAATNWSNFADKFVEMSFFEDTSGGDTPLFPDPGDSGGEWIP